jgi:hypothetical protein
MDMLDPESLTQEESVVWTEDSATLPYVREYFEECAGTRQWPVRWTGPGRRVGYTVLRKDAESSHAPGYFARRVFWVNDYDRCNDPKGIYKTGCPAEGVDPLTVAPGVPGTITRRAWNCDGFEGEPHGSPEGCDLCGAAAPRA